MANSGFFTFMLVSSEFANPLAGKPLGYGDAVVAAGPARGRVDQRRGRRPQAELRSLGQVGLVAQDGEMQLLKLVAGVDAELVGKSLFELLVRGQCVGAAAAAMEGAHELAHEAFAEGMTDQEFSQLRNDFGVLAAGQGGVVELFEGG